MKKMLLILSMFFCVVIADEFVESKTTVGGYGELHYDMEGNSGDGKLDFHRFIVYFKHVFNDQWSLMSEVEIEHNMVGSSDALGYKGGYVAMEQAYLNYFNGDWGFKGGVLLVPAGITNEYHEPPTFMSVERPEYNKYIIPTTWFDNGFAFYGTMGDFNWNFTMTGDMNGDEISDGIRGGRMKGFGSSTADWTKTFQMSWAGMEGLKLGGSYTMNDAPTSAVAAVDPSWVYTTDVVDPSCTAGVFATQAECEAATWNDDADDGTTPEVAGVWSDFTETTTATWDAGSDAVDASFVGVKLMEVNGTYSKDNMYARFEYGSIDYENNSVESSSGYYVDLGYNVADMMDCDGDLYLWTRTSSYSKDDDGDAKDISLFGVTYKPLNNISFKVEMGESGDSDVMRMGLGYMF
tara:strand:+ start:118 stop:1338 length:1221 start_codon:yes stop_codon:yes gene_type:complete